QQGDGGGADVSPCTEGGPGQGQARGTAAASCDGDETHDGEGTECSQERHQHCLPDRKAQRHQGHSEGETQHGDVGCEPHPEQLHRLPALFRGRDGLDTALLCGAKCVLLRIGAGIGTIARKEVGMRHQLSFEFAERRSRRRCARWGNGRSLTVATVSMACWGKADMPWAAPRTAPAIAPIVSVSPPSEAAQHSPSKGAAWNRSTTNSALTTDSWD